MVKLMASMKKILLHACCGPCLTHCVESLRSQEYEPTIFFSDSNIMPSEEYERRRDAARDYATKVEVEFVEDVYDNASWLESVKGLEAEPEGGRRCSACFQHNLRRAADYACEHGFTEFTSTLTVSPHKRSMMVFETGDAVAEAVAEIHPELPEPPKFARFDFKKKNGFLNSLRLAAEYNLYRQNYCGCSFSMRK